MCLEQSAMDVEKHLELATVLNIDILSQYTQAIGGKVLLGSVDVFSQQYPQYLAQLKEAHIAGDLKEVAAQGHKMKGASGAIGLSRLGEWAQFIQHSEALDWPEYYPKFIEKIEQNYLQDIVELRRYLESC